MGLLDFFFGGDDFFRNDQDAQDAGGWWSTSGGWSADTDSVTVGRDYNPYRDDGYTFGGSWGGWNN